MQQAGAFETDVQNENSYVFLQILPEEQHCTTSHIVCTQELIPKVFSLDEFHSLASNFKGPGNNSQTLLCDNKTHSEKADSSAECTPKRSKSTHAQQSTTHVEIIHNSQVNPSSTKCNTLKTEGRKAPGSNRILPLITSVWEDADLLWKRQKPPKGGWKREVKGKGKSSSTKSARGSLDVGEISEEEDWLENQEQDFYGGSLHMAYSDFFMAKEGGEDREDCICGDCGAEFLTATQVLYHLQYHHRKAGVKLYQCFVCRRKRYPTLSQLNQHLSNAHGIPRPELTCRTCFMELAGESEAKAHSRKHQTPYTCSHCSLSHSQLGTHSTVPRFATRFLLAEHFREVHLPQERPHGCNVCGRQFIHKYVRDLHLNRRHHGLSLICPEVRHNSLTSLSETSNPSRALGLPGNEDATKNHANTAKSEVFNKPIDDSGGNSGGNGFSEEGLDPKSGKMSCLNASQKDSMPSALRTEPSICSKGGSHFLDEVSLLCHVFSCHTRETRIQLLKWAREMDREDTVFEGLWKSYSNLSGGQCANGIKTYVNLSNSFQLDTRRKSSSTSFTPIEWPLPKIQVVSNAENTNEQHCDSGVSIVVKDSSSSSTEQVNSNLPPIVDKCSSSAFPFGDTVCPSNESSCETSQKMDATGTVPSATLEGSMYMDQNASKQDRTDVESQKVILRVTTKEGMAESEPSSVPVDDAMSKAVKLCMSNILDSICNVLDERSSLKESKGPSVSTGSQRNVSSVRCLLCRYLAANPMALERHRRRRHFRNKHCPFCSLACPSVEAVWRHVSEVHLSPAKKSTDNGCVSAVEMESQQQQLLLSQKSSQSSSSGLRCPVCKKIFPSRGKCNSHQEIVHKLEVVSRPLSCDICSKKFQFQKALERHKIIHKQSKGKDDGPSLYKCPHCEQTFLRPGFLEPHIASHFENARKVGGDDEAGEKVPLGHPCPSCPRWLTTRAKLKAHIRTSHPPAHLRQRFACNQCSVRCSTASGLRVHVRVHSGERPYSCSLCDARFNRKTALKKHVVAVHPACPDSSASENGGKGSFLKCPNCPSSFRDRSNLVRHFLQVHRGLRRFVCGLCGNRYGQNQDLRHHLKVKHGMEAARIIGSDRRSVDQIYVIPPLLDNLPENHPLVNEIKRIVEEEERKLSEDNLPQFASVPQQLHVRFQKDNGRNSDSVVEETSKHAYGLNTLQRALPEKAVDDAFNSCVASQSNLNTSGEQKTNEISKGMKGVHKLSAKNAYLGAENRSTLENGTTSSNASPCGRNLILDAIISSQISTETSEVLVGESTQFDQIISHGLAETTKEVENNSCQSTEVNIIVANEPFAASSHSIPYEMDSKDSKTLKSSDKEGKSVRKATQSKRDATPGCHFCDQCGKEFLDAARLERHSKIHKNVKPHVCTVCGKSFVEKYNLKVHMRCHTGERPYKCEDCGKTMRYLKEVVDHRRMHLGERPFICQECSRAFLRLRDLQRHQFTHSAEKKHKCPICDKEFSRLDHLRTVHMRVHDPHYQARPKIPKKSNEVIGSQPENSSEKIEGDGTYSNELHFKNSKGISTSQLHSCKKCMKQFTTKTKLEQHLVLHSGQKVHKCPTCGRCFALMSYLRAHQNTHRKREGYVQCPKCPRRFASEKTLSVHDEKFHRRIEKTKKFQSSESLSKGGKSKESSSDLPYEEEKFFLARPGDFDVNLDLEDDMNIQEVALFDPASLSEAEKQNTFVYLHVISDGLQLGSESNLIE